jgi:predicted nucleic acid-binding protein
VLLLDNSAWSRILQGRLSRPRAQEIGEQIEARQIGACLPFLLEAGYSARSAADRKQMMARLERFPRVTVDGKTESLALRAQRELAEVGHHRLPPIDVMIAACADRAEAGVLHYDADYDLLAKHTGLRFESVWLAPAGTL